MIKPTIGRVVWYTPTAAERKRTMDPGDQKWSALVSFVHDDRCVNLAAFTAQGQIYSKLSVTLVQDGDDVPGEGYCEWMPYQIGQAKKHEIPAQGPSTVEQLQENSRYPTR